MLFFVISVSEGGCQRKRRCDPSEPPAAHQPGACYSALREPNAPRNRTDNLPARQFKRPKPLSGLAFGKPSRSSNFS